VSDLPKAVSTLTWLGAAAYVLGAGWISLQARRTFDEKTCLKPQFPMDQSASRDRVEVT
jgi:hypothetical protein